MQLFCVFSLLFLSLCSCSVQANGSVTAEGKIDLEIHSALNPVFQEYLGDLLGASQGELVLFDTEKIKEQLENAGGLRVKHISTSDASLNLELSLEEPAKLFSQESKDVQGFLKTGVRKGMHYVEFRFNRNVLNAVSSLVVSEAGQELSYLLPKDGKMKTAEYRKNLDWAMEDYGTVQSRTQMFDAANLIFTLKVPAAIKKTEGFAVDSGNNKAAVLKISLLDLMVEEAEKVYAIYW